MICSVAQFNMIEATGGNSGLHPSCAATPVAFFYGEFLMNCKHKTCPLLGISLIPLSRGKFTIVDIEDYDWLSQWKWCAAKHGRYYYAQRNVPGSVKAVITIHQMLLPGSSVKKPTDHINYNSLDNRKNNLRRCTAAENQHNRYHAWGASKYKGVSKRLDKYKKNPWQTHIRCSGTQIYLGCFPSEEIAAKAYNQKAMELFGEFACLNITGGELCQKTNTTS